MDDACVQIDCAAYTIFNDHIGNQNKIGSAANFLQKICSGFFRQNQKDKKILYLIIKTSGKI